jgi:hypothetical protein
MLMLLTLVAAIAASTHQVWWPKDKVASRHEQEMALKALRDAGALVYEETRYDDFGYTIAFDADPTDGDLKTLRAIPDLRELYLGGKAERKGPTDDQLAELRHLSQLRALSLNNTFVTDEGLAHLRQLKNLTYLDLNYNTLTYKGLSQLLPHLPNLEWLFIEYNPDVTAEQEKRLSTLVPGCLIEGRTWSRSPKRPAGSAERRD